MAKSKNQARALRKRRIRKNVHGSAERPRLTVFKSNKHIYAQVIDDDRGVTLASASTLSPGLKAELGDLKKVDQAKKVGALAGQAAKDAGVSMVVFDRNGYPYAGRVAAVADGAREAGLTF